MSHSPLPATTRVFPFLRYEDAPAAFEWLARAFGFEKQMLVPGPDGTIAHAQLRYGGSVIMIGSITDDVMKLKRPAVVGGATQGLYVHVDDVDAHHDRAKAAGAEIIMELEDSDYGSREYIARDPEGHVWSFGTYAPDMEGGNT
ncbi:MAG: VOC family protein [Vicinamibacterales bacterium]|nr:VOC family protein [Vicinamibacterales bacterium]